MATRHLDSRTATVLPLGPRSPVSDRDGPEPGQDSRRPSVDGGPESRSAALPTMFLLVMDGCSFFRNSIHSFLCSEIDDVRTVAVASVEEISKIEPAQRAMIRLVLLYIGQRPATGSKLSGEIAGIRSAFGETPVVLLGDRADQSESINARRLGTRGYIPLSTPAEIVRHALPLVAAGGVLARSFVHDITGTDDPVLEPAQPPAPESQPCAAVDGARFNEIVFTRREEEVLALLCAGLQNKLIAYRLNLKESTVKVHMRHIMKKLKVTSRTQAALIAQNWLRSDRN